jgi:hypothetical protein
MAKRKAARKGAGKRTDGPYLAAAFFCETTIEDKQDGTITAVRMIDQILINLPPSTPEDVPSETKKLPVPVSGLLSFRSGDSPGEHTVRIVAESPSGKKQTVLEQVLLFSSPVQGGANLRLNQVIQVKKGGLFWLHVFLDGKRYARMPLMIEVQREGTTPQQDAAKPPA